MANRTGPRFSCDQLKEHPGAQIDPEFADIFPLDNKFHRRCFRRLQRAYIDARYSEHYEITVEELEYLQLQVEKLKAIVERVCQARVDTCGV